jgi:hypothetical protein
MKHISRDTISQMEKIERLLNLINSCGYKSASLLGTKSLDGKTNVAILVALPFRSNPAMIGFIMRPTTVPRDTYTLKKLDILQ